jgi:tetratricopeptide (TPR) repeat protein
VRAYVTFGLALLVGTMAWAQSVTAYQRGAAAFDADNCAGAIPDLEAAKLSVSRANLLLGRCYFESQSFPKAIEALTNYRKTEAADIPALVLLAQALQRNSQGGDGVTLLEGFLKDHPDETSVDAALADLYVQMDQGDKASAELQKVLAKRPEDPFAHIGLGKLALKQQKWQVAIDEFGRAKAVVPNNFDVLYGIGMAYVRLNNCQSAAEPLRQALRLAPVNYSVAKPLAACYEKLQKWSDLMLVALQTGTKEEAADEETTTMAVHAYQGLNDPPAAEKYYRVVLAAAPTNVTALVALGNVLYDAKKAADARKEYLDAVNLKPDLLNIQERLGQMAENAGTAADIDEAIRRYKLAAVVPGGTDSARMSLANLCYGKKDKDLPCARTALDGITDPARALTVKTLRAQIEFTDFEQSKDPAKLELAGRLANDVLTGLPDNIILLKIAAKVAYEQDKLTEAVTLLTKALSMDPSDQDVRYKLVREYLNNPDLNGLPTAISLLTEFTLKYTQDYEAYLLLGDAYRRQNDAANAGANFQKGLDHLPPHPEARLSPFFVSYGMLLFNSNDPDRYEKARVPLTLATQLNPSDENAQLNLAMTCLQLGPERRDQLTAARDKLAELKSPLLVQLEQAIAAAPQPKIP